MFIIIIFSLTIDPERPWTKSKLEKSKYHSKICNWLYNCNINNKLSIQYHLIPTKCGSSPNKLSSRTTKIYVPKVYKVGKCIMQLINYTTYMYVLKKLLIIILYNGNVKTIQSFSAIMDETYHFPCSEYMYNCDHRNTLNMIICEFYDKRNVRYIFILYDGCIQLFLNGLKWLKNDMYSRINMVFHNHDKLLTRTVWYKFVRLSQKTFMMKNETIPSKSCYDVLCTMCKNCMRIIHLLRNFSLISENPVPCKILTAKVTWFAINRPISRSSHCAAAEGSKVKYVRNACKITKNLKNMTFYRINSHIHYKNISETWNNIFSTTRNQKDVNSIGNKGQNGSIFIFSRTVIMIMNVKKHQNIDG